MSAGVPKIYYNFPSAYPIYQMVPFPTHYFNNTETYVFPLLSVYRIFSYFMNQIQLHLFHSITYVICLTDNSLTFVGPCIIVQFIKKDPTRCNSLSKFIIPYLYEAQHVSGNTLPIIKSLKLQWRPLDFRT
jgi:hypothetical protein